MANEAQKPGGRGGDRMRRLYAALLTLSSSVCLTCETLALPRKQSITEGDLKDVDFFDSMSFYEQFRFDKTQFWQILHGMRWLRADGSPRVLSVGVFRHRMKVRTDPADE